MLGQQMGCEPAMRKFNERCISNDNSAFIHGTFFEQVHITSLLSSS